MARRLVVIGAGPIGIEAALAAQARGFDVTVLERDVVGASLVDWGPTKFFSPFSMNVSERLREALGAEAPGGDELLTGPEFARRVLVPIADGPLAGRVKTGHTVVKVGRDRLLRRDKPGHPMRAERPFLILAEGPDGEALFTADFVFDASGVPVPAYLGSGGVPAIGERKVADRFLRTLGALHRRLPELGGRKVLVVGHGHSAANALVALAQKGDVEVTWATRSFNKRPCVEVAGDPLPERATIVKEANALAQNPPAWLTVERRAHVVRFADEDGKIRVELSGERSDTYDAVAGLVGYGPDTSLFAELAVEISPVTEGAAGIQRALSNVTDCLAVPKLGVDDLASGEPNFYMLGFKSYGRSSTFLLKNGLEQLESILEVVDAK